MGMPGTGLTLESSFGMELLFDRRRRSGGRPELVDTTVAEVVFIELRGESMVEREVRELFRCMVLIYCVRELLRRMP